MDVPKRFSTEQVLRGIQAYVTEHVDEQLVLDPDASVNDYREAIEESHECPLWFLNMLASYFGFEYGESRWVVWLDLPRGKGVDKKEGKRRWELWQETTAKTITIRSLAEHIARHAPGVSMNPVTLFGVPCAPAGAFRGLCELPEVQGKRVAPSTAIAKIFGGEKIEQLWGRAKWVSGAELPQLKKTPWWSFSSLANWIDAFGLGVALIATLAALIYVGCSTGSVFWAFAAALPTLCVLLIVTYHASDAVRNPLPDGVQTFGDLARLIAAVPAA